MATVKVKIVSSIAGENFSYTPGDVIDLDEDIARAWQAAGLSIPAPEGEVAAAQIAELTAQLADVIGARDGLAAAKTDLEGKLAAAQAEKKGAIAERAVYKKTADDTKAAQAAAEKALADAATKAASELADAKAAADAAAAQADDELAAVARERDDFRAQAEELGRQLEAAKAAAPAAQ